MTPQERDIIGGIFDRLRQAEGQPRDPQAEAFIAERIRQQPYAPYIMAQTIYMQEQALANLQQQIEDLQHRQAQPQQSGGFLSSLFGGGRPAAPPPPPAHQQAPAYQQQPMGAPQGGPGPWQQQPMAQQPPQRGGMGFLGTAAAAAVGVAGGMMAANALSNAFANGAGGPQAANAATPENASWNDAGQNSWSNQQESNWDGGGDWGGGGGGGGDWGSE
jgi:hypothetical protein